MKTPFLKTYVMLALALALGAYIFFVEAKRTPSTEDKPAPPKERIFADLVRDKIEELTITRSGGETIRLVKQAGAWRLAAPQDVAAAPGEVDQLLGTLASLESEATAQEQPTQLATFGLEAPRLVVAVKTAGASQARELALGADVPARDWVFAKLASSPRVFAVATQVRAAFDKQAFDLRDRDLLHVQRSDVRTLDVTGPEGGYSLTRAERDTWRITRPIETVADRFAVDRVVSAVEALRMEAVAADPAKNLKAFGLTPPARVVTVGLANGGRKVLEMGGSLPGSKLYAREAGSPLVAVISPTLVDELKKGLGALRDKRLLDISFFDVDGFDLQTGDSKKSFARSPAKKKDGPEPHEWKRTAPDTQDLDTKRVQSAVFKIGDVNVTEFVDRPQALDAYGLDRPVVRLSLRLAATAGAPGTSSWLEIGQKDGAYYARRPNDAAILRVDPASAAALVKALTDL